MDTYLERMLQPKRPGWKHRLNDIRALEQTLVRDREVLLSQVPSDTLLGWIDWIVTHDLNRFRTRYYVVEGAKGIPGERPIETEVRKLLRMLLDLRAKVLRLKTDYRACIEARILQIEHLLEDLEFPVHVARGIHRQPRTYRYDREIDEIKQNLISKYKTPLLKKSQRRRCFDALAALLDIGVCFNGLGEFEQAASIIAWLRWAIEPMKAKKGKEGIELAEHYEPLELKIHFRAAELILSSVDRWDYKNDALGASSDLEERCDRAIKECEAGQRIVHETNTEPEKYFVYRSSLRILRRGRWRLIPGSSRPSKTSTGRWPDLTRALEVLVTPWQSEHCTWSNREWLLPTISSCGTSGKHWPPRIIRHAFPLRASSSSASTNSFRGWTPPSPDRKRRK